MEKVQIKSGLRYELDHANAFLEEQFDVLQAIELDTVDKMMYIRLMTAYRDLIKAAESHLTD